MLLYQALPLLHQLIILCRLARELIALFLKFYLFINVGRQLNNAPAGCRHLLQPSVQVSDGRLYLGLRA